MFSRAGRFFAEEFKKWLPDSFVFAVILTIITAVLSLFWVDASVDEMIGGWYRGFWLLLEFSMQIILILVTGFAIALSPLGMRYIDGLADRIHKPVYVYVTVILLGGLLSLVSWSWVVIVAVLGRELAKRVAGVDYPFLVACIYMSTGPWVGGLSSSIPLLLNTPDNFLIEAGLLNNTIPISETLGSSLNFLFVGFFLVSGPIMMLILRPKPHEITEMTDLQTQVGEETGTTVTEEAESLEHQPPTFSDRLNGSVLLQGVIVLMGGYYILRHFYTRGADLNLNIMIFTFIILGLAFHVTPMRYVVAMKRACSNISGIVFQYPFYAGIMGMMMFTGLGKAIAGWMASVVTLKTLPLAAFVLGGVVNFSIPSAGGEWAVIGPSLVESATTLGADLSPGQLDALVARVGLATAYGESLTNLLQPFFLLVILPVLGAGVKVQARDIMGYVFIPFLFFFTCTGLMIFFHPL
ncbi:MAG: TIGR00366 family protein [Acidobacteriota bacterium]|nr:TIGR00366 family protein [Acidobacteriota bacterium]